MLGFVRNITCCVLGVVLLVGMSGCSALLPGAQYFAEYIVNRDGEYFFGLHCSDGLTEIGVFVGELTIGQTEEGFDDAVWHAVADSPVDEFELFASEQEGVVVFADAWDGDLESLVAIIAVDEAGYKPTLESTLGNVEDGFVSSAAGYMTWEEYMAMENSEFRCS